MNKFKLSLIVMTAALLMLAIPGLAGDYHNAGLLQCNDCHTMHYSEGGATPTQANGFPVDADSGGPFPKLLVKDNITDICLSCHGDSGVGGGNDANAPIVYNSASPGSDGLPGGDFDYSATDTSGNAASAPVGKGHNPAGKTGAQSAYFDLDIKNGGASGIIPPGNSSAALVAGKFDCTSCHEPHGPLAGGTNHYAFRMLLKSVNGDTTSFSSDSILSVAWSNESTAGADGADLANAVSTTNMNVYRGGFSRWCSSCHPDFHGTSADANMNDGTDWLRHPTKEGIGSTYAGNYGTNYDPTYPLLKVGGAWTKTAVGAIASTDQIFCLSCHQAHASNYPNAVRWNQSSASAQGQCNKCHQKGG